MDVQLTREQKLEFENIELKMQNLQMQTQNLQTEKQGLIDSFCRSEGKTLEELEGIDLREGIAKFKSTNGE